MNILRKVLIAFICTTLVLLSVGAVWNAAFEAIPGAGALVSDIDTFLINTKIETRERLEVETIFGAAGDDNGLHQLGSARAFIQR